MVAADRAYTKADSRVPVGEVSVSKQTAITESQEGIIHYIRVPHPPLGSLLYLLPLTTLHIETVPANQVCLGPPACPGVGSPAVSLY